MSAQARTLTLPATVDRAGAKALISSLKDEAIAALALGSASKTAQREGFIAATTAIALQRMIFGGQSIYDAIVAKARKDDDARDVAQVHDFLSRRATSAMHELGDAHPRIGEACELQASDVFGFGLGCGEQTPLSGCQF